LDDKRRKAVRGRLREKFTVEDLSLACDGIFLSPFHMGQNDGSKRYVDLELVCRDAKRVEGFMAIATDARTVTAGAAGGANDEGGFVPPPPDALEAMARLLKPKVGDIAEMVRAEDGERGSDVRLRVPAAPSPAAAGAKS
jgi:hypothetical protein